MEDGLPETKNSLSVLDCWTLVSKSVIVDGWGECWNLATKSDIVNKIDVESKSENIGI
jgi:hypothetical protein